MFIFVDSLNNLDEFIRNEAPIRIIATYYLAMIPVVLGQIVPAGSLMAALYFLGQLSKHNEIVAIKASGTSGLRILFPILFIGFLLSMGLLAMNETITPKASILSTSIKKDVIESDKNGLEKKSLQNVALLTKDNQMVYARELHIDTSTLFDVIIIKLHKNFTLKSKITGRTATYQDGIWTLYDVIQYSLDTNSQMIGQPTSTKSMVLNITETPDQFVLQSIKTEFMNYRQLKSRIQNLASAGRKSSNRMLVDLYGKMITPFTCFIILLIGAPIALKTRRGGAMLSLTVGVCIVGLYYFAIAIGAALGKGAVIPPYMAAWGPHAIFFFLGCYLVRRYI